MLLPKGLIWWILAEFGEFGCIWCGGRLAWIWPYLCVDLANFVALRVTTRRLHPRWEEIASQRSLRPEPALPRSRLL